MYTRECFRTNACTSDNTVFLHTHRVVNKSFFMLLHMLHFFELCDILSSLVKRKINHEKFFNDGIETLRKSLLISTVFPTFYIHSFRCVFTQSENFIQWNYAPIFSLFQTLGTIFSNKQNTYHSMRLVSVVYV
jgi:hypothetical protein